MQLLLLILLLLRCLLGTFKRISAAISICPRLFAAALALSLIASPSLSLSLSPPGLLSLLSLSTPCPSSACASSICIARWLAACQNFCFDAFALKLSAHVLQAASFNRQTAGEGSREGCGMAERRGKGSVVWCGTSQRQAKFVLS